MLINLEMKHRRSSTESVASPPTSTLQDLKKIADVIENGSYTKGVRRIALAVRMTVGLRRKLTGSVISDFFGLALVPGSEAHTRLSSFVKSDADDKKFDTASTTSQAPLKHLHDQLEIYCYFIVLLFLINQKKYKEAKVCSSATIGRLNRVNKRTVGVIASNLEAYYYLRCDSADVFAETRSTLLAIQQLAKLQQDELVLKVMDPNDPYSFHPNFQPNFMNLLPTQENMNPETHISFSPSVQMSSSQFPQSSTQFSDAQNQPAKSRESRTRWTFTEDMVLISAWLNTSKDPIVGNEQNGGAFWKRIVSYYGASEDVVGFPARGITQCTQRWKKITSECNKFVGCYSQASARRGSGQSEDDVFQMALQLYFNDKKKPFLLEHAWRTLRHEQKWLCSFGDESSKRTKLSAGDAYSSSSNTSSRVEEEVCPRPPGVKAAKRKGKRYVPSSESEATPLPQLEKMWEIKEKDIASRDKAADKRLLANLIAKTELSEAELALKNKLMAEMFG